MAPLSESKPLALVTGLAGFTGVYLRSALESRGWRVIGVDHNVDPAMVQDIRRCDLLDRDAVKTLVDELSPQAVIHLAGISSVNHGNPGEIYQVNIMGTRNLLEALSTLEAKPRSVILASTANIYGNTGGYALDEVTPPEPTNDYAVSKLAMEYMALTFRAKLPLTLIRPFNYTGRGQTTRFVIPKIIEHFHSRAPSIELGNLDVTREFSDVRRVAQAYARLLELPGRGVVYNIASGVGVTLREVIAIASWITGHRIEVRFNPAFARENEVEILIGSCSRLEAAVGTLPSYTIEETLRWMLQSEG